MIIMIIVVNLNRDFLIILTLTSEIIYDIIMVISNKYDDYNQTDCIQFA